MAALLSSSQCYARCAVPVYATPTSHCHQHYYPDELYANPSIGYQGEQGGFLQQTIPPSGNSAPGAMSASSSVGPTSSAPTSSVTES